MKIMGIAGWSGSGKTTLVVSLLPRLIASGFKVSTLKHAHHDFDLDKPGKDSYEHRHAGASEVMVGSARRWALFHELGGEPEPSIEQLSRHMAPADLLLVEGFKKYTHAKIEVHRPAIGKLLLQPGDPHIVAVASDAPMDGLTVPRLDLNDVAGIVSFIIDYCDLKVA